MTIAIISQDDFHHQQQKSSPSLKCNLMMASQFLSALSEGESVTFQTFDDTMRKDRTLARIFHGTLEDHSEELADIMLIGLLMDCH